MNRPTLLLALVALLAVLGASPRARAGESAEPVRLALVIGVNRAVDANLAELRYADDDAVRWRDLLRKLGATTRTLTRVDEATRRLHPDAEGDAAKPTSADLDRAVAALASEATAARARGASVLLYVVYAGHGDVRNGQGYVTLEDARLTGPDLAERVLGKIGATRTHVIVDACGSYYLAYGRGPGGERRKIDVRPASFELTRDPSVGVLLSTSSARDSHEWEAVQGGVFSHEVRSGLLGAADADGDGVITYREIAAFVARANAGIPNEKYRPDVFARAPSAGAPVLADVRGAREKRIEIDGAHAGHWVLESATGVRLAEVHTATGHAVTLVRPSDERLYLLRLGDVPAEIAIAPDRDVVLLASLEAEAPRARSRGALHEAFEKLFSVPFDQRAVEEWTPPPPPKEQPPEEAGSPRGSPRKTVGKIALGVGAAALVTAGGLAIGAKALERGVGASESQADVERRNRTIQDLGTASLVTLISGAATAFAGGALLLWPDPVVDVARGGAVLGVGGRF